MALIFSASGDRKSFQHSRVIAPVIRWLLPQLSPEGVDRGVFLVRKLAHLTEYAILALLLWRALRGPQENPSLPWNWKQASLVLLMIALYAATDEFHQSFVPSRQASIVDVFIDITGGISGLLFVMTLARCRPVRVVPSLPAGPAASTAVPASNQNETTRMRPRSPVRRRPNPG